MDVKPKTRILSVDLTATSTEGLCLFGGARWIRTAGAVRETLAATALGPRAASCRQNCARISTASPNPLPIRAGCVTYGL